MKIDNSPSLQDLNRQVASVHDDKNIKIIRRSNYLRNIRDELLEVEETTENKENNEITFITAEIQGIPTEIVVDTGANVSLIDLVEFNRIKEQSKEKIDTLPISNMVIVGATGRLNKTIRQHAMLEVASHGQMIIMVFLVVQGLPFKAMIGCDVLRQHSAIIDMCSGKITLYLSLIHI